jgi:hypothetical protein
MKIPHDAISIPAVERIELKLTITLASSKRKPV